MGAGAGEGDTDFRPVTSSFSFTLGGGEEGTKLAPAGFFWVIGEVVVVVAAFTLKLEETERLGKAMVFRGPPQG